MEERAVVLCETLLYIVKDWWKNRTLSSAGSERRSRLRRDGGREESMYSVYILYSESRKKYYIGSTGELQRRVSQHNSSRYGFTAVGRPWRLVYSAEYLTKTEALRREHYLKSMKSSRFIENLINTEGRSADA